MNFPHYLAKRIAFTKDKSFTRIIIRIAIATIAISMTVMIMTSAVTNGFKREITDKIFGFWGHIHITDSNVSRIFEVVPIEGDQTVFNEIRNIKQVEYEAEGSFLGLPFGKKKVDMVTKGGVKGVYPYIVLPGLITTKKNIHGVLLKGIDEHYKWESMSKFLVEGSWLKFPQDINDQQIILSRNMAKKLSLEPNDKIILSFVKNNVQWKRRFTICGLYNTGLEEYDKRLALLDINVLREVLGWSDSEVQGMEVVLDDISDMDILADYIYYENVPSNMYVETIRSKFPSIFEWLNLQNVNERVITNLMILVGLINMATVLLILVLERTRMIGILKALGSNIWQIRKVFLYHAAYIIFLGLVIGNVIGLSLAFLQKKFGFISLDENNYYLDTAPIYIDVYHIIWLNLATFLMTLLFLILPTFLVSKISPLKAIRFE
ncbi:MAG: FtsX-like permease family protein [Saprospiraceae bacterium]